jgi:hypothetical protein
MPKTNNKKRKCQQEFVEWSSTAPNTFWDCIWAGFQSFSDPGSSSRCLFWPRVTVEFLPERIERLMKQKCFKSDTVKSIKKKVIGVGLSISTISIYFWSKKTNGHTKNR